MQRLDETAVDDRDPLPARLRGCVGGDHGARSGDLGGVGCEEPVRGVDRARVHEGLPVEPEVAPLSTRGLEANVVLQVEVDAVEGGEAVSARGEEEEPEGG